MTYPKIKPCPDCGNSDMSMYAYGDWGTTWHVECEDCHYMGPGDNKLMAIRRHNENVRARAALEPSDA